jgi:hypothetical protein
MTRHVLRSALFCKLWLPFCQRQSALAPERSDGMSCTVLFKSIRQSRITRVPDVTNFATLSRVTEAFDEYTFSHDETVFKQFINGILAGRFLGRIWRIKSNYLTIIKSQIRPYPRFQFTKRFTKVLIKRDGGGKQARCVRRDS